MHLPKVCLSKVWKILSTEMHSAQVVRNVVLLEERFVVRLK